MKEKIGKFFSKRNISWLVLAGYTFINMWILSFFVFGKDSIYYATITHAGNSNLLAIFIGLFLNTGMILYTKIITNRKLEGLLLLIYSYLNIRTAFPFLSRGELEVITMVPGYGSAHNLFAIILGLFFNATLIIYWLKSNHE